MRRSFTLLETVTAAALLAMLAASGIGALRAITLAADRSAAIIDVGALSLAIDDLLSKPEEHGLPELTDGAAWDGLLVQRPDHTESITIRRIVAEPGDRGPAGGPARHHAWLIFESQGAAVARWLPLPEPREPAP